MTAMVGGSIDRYSLLEGEVVTVTCLQGYQLEGNGQGTCTASGDLDPPLGI